MLCSKFLLTISLVLVCVYADSDNVPPPQPPASTTTVKPTTPPTKPTTTAPTTTAPTTTTTKATTTSTITPKTTTTAKPTPAPVTTTTVAPPTPAPRIGIWSANFTDTNNTCIVLQVALQVEIPTKDNKTLKINLPTAANASGDCPAKANEENLVLVWGEGNRIEFDFNKTDKTKFELKQVKVALNVTLPGEKATVYNYVHEKCEFAAPISNSYKCDKEQTFTLRRSDNATAQLHISNVQLQAFRNATGQHFDSPLDCDSSQKPDAVPIVVGCVLAGLVILILAGYLIGRRRCQARGYLSM